MSGWRDNRDMRDSNYKGELVVPCNVRTFSVTKEEALKTMKQILINDVSDYEIKVEKLQKEIEYSKDQIELASKRLKEF